MSTTGMLSSWLHRAGVFSVIPTALSRLSGGIELVQSGQTRAPVSPTPSQCVARIGAARLLKFESPLPPTSGQTIVLCPSLINRLYILDLKQDISTVAALQQAGHQVYGIDWGDPGIEERGVGFEGFVVRLQQLLALACTHVQQPKVHVLGHCLGGTMATALAAVDDRYMRSLINLTVPIAFGDDGMLAKWIRVPFFDAQLMADVFGHIPAWVTQPAFNVLKPMGQLSKAMRTVQSLHKPGFIEFFRCLETWINDNVSIPDAFFVDLTTTLYRDNALVAGGLRLPLLSSSPVSLNQVRIPVLTIAAQEDHIVPLSSAQGGHDRYGALHKKLEILPGGQIGVVVGGLARRRLWPALDQWMTVHGASAPPPPARRRPRRGKS
jgi:polyhydroxyalkanoate synthase subunit PhaC